MAASGATHTVGQGLDPRRRVASQVILHRCPADGPLRDGLTSSTAHAVEASQPSVPDLQHTGQALPTHLLASLHPSHSRANMRKGDRRAAGRGPRRGVSADPYLACRLLRPFACPGVRVSTTRWQWTSRFCRTTISSRLGPEPGDAGCLPHALVLHSVEAIAIKGHPCALEP